MCDWCASPPSAGSSSMHQTRIWCVYVLAAGRNAPLFSLSFFGMQCWWSCQSSLAPRRLPADGSSLTLPGKQTHQFGEMIQKIWFILCIHSLQRKKTAERDPGKSAERLEEELEDRQNLYLQCCKLILHFIDAFFNQWQIFVVAMASLQQLRLAEPGDLIRFLNFWHPQWMKLICFVRYWLHFWLCF